MPSKIALFTIMASRYKNHHAMAAIMREQDAANRREEEQRLQYQQLSRQYENCSDCSKKITNPKTIAIAARQETLQMCDGCWMKSPKNCKTCQNPVLALADGNILTQCQACYNQDRIENGYPQCPNFDKCGNVCFFDKAAETYFRLCNSCSKDQVFCTICDHIFPRNGTLVSHRKFQCNPCYKGLQPQPSVAAGSTDAARPYAPVPPPAMKAEEFPPLASGVQKLFNAASAASSRGNLPVPASAASSRGNSPVPASAGSRENSPVPASAGSRENSSVATVVTSVAAVQIIEASAPAITSQVVEASAANISQVVEASAANISQVVEASAPAITSQVVVSTFGKSSSSPALLQNAAEMKSNSECDSHQDEPEDEPTEDYSPASAYCFAFQYLDYINREPTEEDATSQEFKLFLQFCFEYQHIIQGQALHPKMKASFKAYKIFNLATNKK